MLQKNWQEMDHLLQDMAKQHKRRTIFTDRLYTSIESKNWLLARDITTVRTLQRGRQGILFELFHTKDREEFSATCHFEKD